MTQDDKQAVEVMSDALDWLWKFMYPDEPKGWEYPGQCVRHAKAIIEEQRVSLKKLRRSYVETCSQGHEFAVLRDGLPHECPVCLRLEIAKMTERLVDRSM